MSAAEINDARCPDCNAPTIWERTADADEWSPMRCDKCQQCHDAEELASDDADETTEATFRTRALAERACRDANRRAWLLSGADRWTVTEFEQVRRQSAHFRW